MYLVYAYIHVKQFRNVLFCSMKYMKVTMCQQKLADLFGVILI